ncbi:hypothetical protein BDN71DRAFT_1458787 [Pleurotus eryngii]|uniref:Uncharacterized protein n=1 Tax=Pleurotus eryngii TaxID=5323 RepID=A0A9P5ZIV4_PLEER|nr:hypothetical protein BDN71DRAFT_1458787 [Pleurotus eryngii]
MSSDVVGALAGGREMSLDDPLHAVPGLGTALGLGPYRRVVRLGVGGLLSPAHPE